MSPAERQRLRLRYRKDEVLMYIGHRDLLRFIHRVLRRAMIPFATSGEYSPKPRVVFGPALSLGVLAENELLDIELKEGMHWRVAQVAEAVSRLVEAALPRDLVVTLSVLDSQEPLITKLVASAEYRMSYEERPAAVYDFLTNGEPLTDANDKNPRDLREAISHIELFERDIIITAAANAEQSLNIVKLSRQLSERLGLEPIRLCRECLFGDDGQPL